MDMKLYVSGPVTGYKDGNRPAFDEAAGRLREAGYDACGPHDVVPAPWHWGQAMRKAVGEMLECDGVALLPDWQDSRGACIERRLALDLGMPVGPGDERVAERGAWEAEK